MGGVISCAWLRCHAVATTKQSGAGRPIELEGAWGELATKAGGVTALCEKLGVHKTTFYRWISGESPIRGPAQIAIKAVAAELKVKPPTM
jgi:hypothetical protein